MATRQRFGSHTGQCCNGDAASDRAREGILVSATGEVLGVPDTLSADFAVGTTAATVDDALNLR